MNKWNLSDTAVDLMYAIGDLLETRKDVVAVLEKMDTTAEAASDGILDILGIPQNSDDFNRGWYYDQIKGYKKEYGEAKGFLNELVKGYWKATGGDEVIDEPIAKS